MMPDSVLDNVSRETIDRLREYEEMVQKWTRKINLVSTGDASNIWERHILDSVQVHQNATSRGHWLDIGSGGGFPGIVAAILSKGESTDRSFVLVDSDQRKCAFLRTVTRELGLNVKVSAERVEVLEPVMANVLSARALGDLNSLLMYAERHLAHDGIALFPKGARWQQEHEAAQKSWVYDLEVIKSETNTDATILKIKEISRA